MSAKIFCYFMNKNKNDKIYVHKKKETIDLIR